MSNLDKVPFVRVTLRVFSSTERLFLFHSHSLFPCSITWIHWLIEHLHDAFQCRCSYRLHSNLPMDHLPILRTTQFIFRRWMRWLSVCCRLTVNRMERHCLLKQQNWANYWEIREWDMMTATGFTQATILPNDWRADTMKCGFKYLTLALDLSTTSPRITTRMCHRRGLLLSMKVTSAASLVKFCLSCLC